MKHFTHIQDYFQSKMLVRLDDDIFITEQPGQVSGNGFAIRYTFVLQDATVYFECYITSRFTDDMHLRFTQTEPEPEILDAIWSATIHDPTISGDEERANREYFEHNQKLAKELKAKGLYD